MWRLAAGIVLCSGLIALAQPLWAQNFAADIPLGSGGNERVLFASAANPRATLIMFPGGSGIVGVSASGTTTNLNFLVRTLPLWLAHGFAVEILDAPNGTSLLGQRHTSGYAAAIDRAIDFARSRANAPVWLVGTSQGSTAAANGAAHLGGKIAGIVLMSSVTGRSSAGETLFDSEPERVTVPVLIVANTGDTCPASTPTDAPKISDVLTQAPRKEILYLDSTAIQGPPCDAESPHSYFGIEQATVEHVAEWITAVSRY